LLKAGITGYPVFIREHYLDDRGDDVLSVTERERLADTVNSILNADPRTRLSSYYRAMAIQQWIANQCVYSLTVDPVPQDQDAVSYFLYTSKKGYCDLFASSMALLCRYAGIPSRVVTGFAPGTRNQKSGFDVRAKDKHAWVEVYFPNLGWFPFDPTSSATQEAPKSAAADNISLLKSMYLFIVTFLNLNGPIPIILFASLSCVFLM